jgi:O-antigen ligase
MMYFATVLLALIINLAPLALGSNRPLPWALNATLAGGLLLVTIFVWALRWRQEPPVLGSCIIWPIVFFVAVLIWIGFQVVPMGNVRFAHPIWLEASQLLGKTTGTISVSPPATIEALMRLLTALSIGLCAYIIGRGTNRAFFLLHGFVIGAAFYAVYGLYRLSSNATKILWFDQPNSGSLTATFISRNNASTYFGLAALTSLALLIRRWRHVAGTEGDGAREKISRLLGSLGGSLGVYFLLSATLFIALFLTGSRAGIGATLIAVGALVLLQLMQARQTGFRGGTATLSAVLIGLLATAGLFELSGAKFVERLTALDVALEDRFAAWSDSSTAIADHLWTGSGYGTFKEIFPLYRLETGGDFLWDKAHNDYLELILDLGLPAALVAFAGFLLIAWQCLNGVFERRRNAIFSMVSVASIVLVGIHAIFDFSLQIQAVTLAFAMLVGLGLAQSYSESL